MHPRKSRHPKRFSETKGIVVEVENPSKSLSKQKPSAPIRPVTINNGSRRSNKHFDRFDTKSSPITVTRLVPEELSHSDTSSDLVHLLHQFETRIKTMLIAHKEETVSAVIEAIQHEKNADYRPFFNSVERAEAGNTATLSKDKYLEFRVELTRPLGTDPIIYPFGRETEYITRHDHELKMKFKSEGDTQGYIKGTFVVEKGWCGFISSIRDLQCFLEDDTPINFSDIDLPLIVTFSGGLL